MIRYFHIRALDATNHALPKGGATVRVVGDITTSEETLVRVSHTLCSANDAFCRKTGRDQAINNPSVTIPLKGLPGYLHKIAKKVARRVPCYLMDVETRSESFLWKLDFGFSKKYFLKKEEVAPVEMLAVAQHNVDVGGYIHH